MPTAEQGSEAFSLQAAVVDALATERDSWVTLAERLHAFHAAEAWRTLGYGSFTVWLGDPDVSLGRSRAYMLVAVWETFVVDNGVQPGALRGLELSKFTHLVGRVARQEISAEVALAEIASLSRADLRTKYGQVEEEGEVELCPTCGQPMPR